MELNIKRYTKEEDGFPQILNQYERMPEELYLLGDFPDPRKRSVAIVGARSCSEYGRSEAVRFAKVLAENGVQIISGMALGIDSASHEGALAGQGRTFAVLGSGVDVCYPVSKRKLYEKIIQNGGVLSEYPPGTPAAAHHFPTRNRIISALCDALIVIEARKKSGSLITASFALEQNKTIYALPGRIRDSLSEGTNDLICQGAVPAISPEQILHDLGIQKQKKNDPEEEDPNFSPEEKKLFKRITSDPKSLNELHEESGLELQSVGMILTRFLLENRIRECSPGRYVKK